MPDKIDKAELRVCRFGRIICEAPLRYDRCPQSLVGEAARTVGPCGAAGFIGISGTVAATGGVKRDEDRTSGVESAWRNLLSGCDLPTVDEALPTFNDALPTFDDALPTAEDALPTAEDALPTAEDALPIAEDGLPTAEDGGEGTTGLRGLLA